jgi:hypothetical protein
MTLLIYLVCGVLALFCAAVAVYMGKRAMQLRNASTQFDQRGVVVKGVVESRQSKKRYVSDRYGGKTVTDYFVSYHYDYNGQTYTGMKPVTEDHYKAWPEGWTVDVTILPDNPAMSRLTADFYPTGFFIGLAAGAGVLGLGAIGLIIIPFIFAH